MARRKKPPLNDAQKTMKNAKDYLKWYRSMLLYYGEEFVVQMAGTAAKNLMMDATVPLTKGKGQKSTAQPRSESQATKKKATKAGEGTLLSDINRAVGGASKAYQGIKTITPNPNPAKAIYGMVKNRKYNKAKLLAQRIGFNMALIPFDQKQVESQRIDGRVKRRSNIVTRTPSKLNSYKAKKKKKIGILKSGWISKDFIGQRGWGWINKVPNYVLKHGMNGKVILQTHIRGCVVTLINPINYASQNEIKSLTKRAVQRARRSTTSQFAEQYRIDVHGKTPRRKKKDE